MKKSIGQAERDLMAPDSKIGLLVTRDDDGYPHITLMTSLQALGTNQVTFGRFSRGLSKKMIVKRPDIGFLVLNTDMRYLTGGAHFTHTANTGEVFDEYNNKPLFRYNSYMGFDQVYFMKLKAISEIQKLQTGRIAVSALRTRLAAVGLAKKGKKKLGHVALSLLSPMDSLKFIAWFDENDNPRILPIVQAAPAGTERVVFSLSPGGKELAEIPEEEPVAVFCVNLKMQSVLMKGTFEGVEGFPKVGVFDVDKVYNPMPPKAGYVYPRAKKPKAVTEWE